jgi:hypothetical protein
MSYIIFIYGLSVAYLLITLMRYKYNENSKVESNHVGKTYIFTALMIKPVFFTAIAWGFNTIEAQLGFWLLGGVHLVFIAYYSFCLYLSNRKQATIATVTRKAPSFR